MWPSVQMEISRGSSAQPSWGFDVSALTCEKTGSHTSIYTTTWWPAECWSNCGRRASQSCWEAGTSRRTLQHAIFDSSQGVPSCRIDKETRWPKTICFPRLSEREKALGYQKFLHQCALTSTFSRWHWKTGTLRFAVHTFHDFLFGPASFIEACAFLFESVCHALLQC